MSPLRAAAWIASLIALGLSGCGPTSPSWSQGREVHVVGEVGAVFELLSKQLEREGAKVEVELEGRLLHVRDGAHVGSILVSGRIPPNETEIVVKGDDRLVSEALAGRVVRVVQAARLPSIYGEGQPVETESRTWSRHPLRLTGLGPEEARLRMHEDLLAMSPPLERVQLSPRSVTAIHLGGWVEVSAHALERGRIELRIQADSARDAVDLRRGLAQRLRSRGVDVEAFKDPGTHWARSHPRSVLPR